MSFVNVDRDNEANAMQVISEQTVPAKTSRVYHPNMLKAMRLALDLACARLSACSKDQESARTQLAIQILRGAEPLNADPDRLASFAIEELLLGSLQTA